MKCQAACQPIAGCKPLGRNIASTQGRSKDRDLGELDGTAHGLGVLAPKGRALQRSRAVRQPRLVGPCAEADTGQGRKVSSSMRMPCWPPSKVLMRRLQRRQPRRRPRLRHRRQPRLRGWGREPRRGPVAEGAAAAVLQRQRGEGLRRPSSRSGSPGLPPHARAARRRMERHCRRGHRRRRREVRAAAAAERAAVGQRGLPGEGARWRTSAVHGRDDHGDRRGGAPGAPRRTWREGPGRQHPSRWRERPVPGGLRGCDDESSSRIVAQQAADTDAGATAGRRAGHGDKARWPLASPKGHGRRAAPGATKGGHHAAR
mmetsp:Transcript_60376/g.197575  ORF Transcript_60376/g.197575 Transcript_60376/m.197575 type:complete len:316 (-) Transcript_60376:1122-2069(-)